MNFATSLCKRLTVSDLITRITIFPSVDCNCYGKNTFKSTEPCIDVSGDGLSVVFRRWSTKRTAGSTKNGRDSNSKFLGVKKFRGERVGPGNIIVRQRGTRFHPGDYVGMGRDHTLHALKEGRVKFEHHKMSGRKWVNVEPKEGHELHPIYLKADVDAAADLQWSQTTPHLKWNITYIL